MMAQFLNHSHSHFLYAGKTSSTKIGDISVSWDVCWSQDIYLWVLFIPNLQELLNLASPIFQILRKSAMSGDESSGHTATVNKEVNCGRLDSAGPDAHIDKLVREKKAIDF